jgi:hypothetical protein
MKKILGFALAVLVAGGAVAATVTNYLGQVVTVDANGVVTAITVPQTGTNQPRTQVGLVGLRVDTNATTTLSSYVPRDIGDLLVGATGSVASKVVWVATGVTTSDWKKITP